MNELLRVWSADQAIHYTQMAKIIIGQICPMHKIPRYLYLPVEVSQQITPCRLILLLLLPPLCVRRTPWWLWVPRLPPHAWTVRRISRAPLLPRLHSTSPQPVRSAHKPHWRATSHSCCCAACCCRLSLVCDEWASNLKVVLFSEEQIQRKVRSDVTSHAQPCPCAPHPGPHQPALAGQAHGFHARLTHCPACACVVVMQRTCR